MPLSKPPNHLRITKPLMDEIVKCRKSDMLKLVRYPEPVENNGFQVNFGMMEKETMGFLRGIISQLMN